MTDPAAAALDHLAALGATFEAMDCDPALADTAAFCAHYDVPPSHSANAIVVKSKRGEPRFGLVLVLATHRVNNRAIRKLLGTSKASFASANETRELTGMMIGGVTPFGLNEDLPIWIDSAVAALPWCIVGGGSRSVKFKVAPSVIADLPNASVIDDLATAPPDRSG
jgi:prolyl-tRNA editing enzyme YbaK/EbsC (Cys-tRNA(Pro) deacylase)